MKRKAKNKNYGGRTVHGKDNYDSGNNVKCGQEPAGGRAVQSL